MPAWSAAALARSAKRSWLMKTFASESQMMYAVSDGLSRELIGT